MLHAMALCPVSVPGRPQQGTHVPRRRSDPAITTALVHCSIHLLDQHPRYKFNINCQPETADQATKLEKVA